MLILRKPSYRYRRSSVGYSTGGWGEDQGSQEEVWCTHTDTEVDSIIAVHLLRRPAQGRVQSRIHYELVVPPLEARGFLPISPTFLVHPCSFTLSGKEGYAMGVQGFGLTPLLSPQWLAQIPGSPNSPVSIPQHDPRLPQILP